MSVNYSNEHIESFELLVSCDKISCADTDLILTGLSTILFISDCDRGARFLSRLFDF
jgi:hypothetical protein